MCYNLVEVKVSDTFRYLNLTLNLFLIFLECTLNTEYLLLMSSVTTKINVLLYLKISYFFNVLLVIHVTLCKFSLKFLTCISVQF